MNQPSGDAFANVFAKTPKKPFGEAAAHIPRTLVSHLRDE
jgi:hypothetical protein